MKYGMRGEKLTTKNTKGKVRGYPKYKPSGVEWLGDVPEHWGVRKLKYSCQHLTTKTDRRQNPVALENIESWTGRFVETESEFEGEGIAFKKDDILFGKLRPYLAKVLKASKDGEAVGDFFVLRPLQNIYPDYAAFILRSEDYIDIIDGSTFGSKMPRASWEFMGNLPCILPPLSEQQAIATFLDRETGRIDTLIGKKKKLVELLKEKRTALISRAVTKGLDASVRMKPSGVEWLGTVPEHWEVKRLKNVAYLKSGDGITVEEIEDDAEYPVYGGNGFRGFTNRYTHDGEFVLIGRQGALCGNINYAHGKFWASEHAVVITSSKPVAVFWLGELLRIMNLNQYSISAAQPGLAIDRIKELVLPVPPLPEQKAIATFLDRETAKIDALISKVETAIEKLKEYRTALISATVTGKIDIRKEVAV